MDLSEIEGLLATFCAKETTFADRLIAQAQLKQWLDNFNKNMGTEPLSFDGLLEFYGDHNKARSLEGRRGWAGCVWEVQSPEGFKIRTGNISQLCRENGLNDKNFRSWLRNGRMYDTFMGWRKVSVHGKGKDVSKYKPRLGYFQSLAVGSPEWEKEKQRLEDLRNRKREILVDARERAKIKREAIREQNKLENGEGLTTSGSN